MSYSIVGNTVGQLGVNPRIVKIISTDILSVVTSAGYLNQATNVGVNLLPTDIVLMSYSGGENFFTLTIVNGIVTLSALESLGNVLLPVVNGHLAEFNGTSGQIKDSGAQLSGPGLPFVASTNGSNTIGDLAVYASVNGDIANSGIAANHVLTTSINTPDINANLVVLTITITAAALASAGKIPIVLASLNKQYQILDMWLNGSGTGFNGIGDRSVGVTDGVTTWGTLTNTTLGALPIAEWGSTAFPYATPDRATVSVAGNEIYLQYNGGTIDYGTGSSTMNFVLQRVA